MTTDVTRILNAIQEGDVRSAERLLPLIYEELRQLAAKHMAQEASDHTLQATALVHEAYVRLVDVENQQQWTSRAHFFGAAAEAMRRILVENVRRKKRLKHGGAFNRVDLSVDSLPSREDQVLLVNDSLDALAAQNTQAAQIVKLRFFAGLTLLETAATMDISARTADRLWAYAKAWLHDQINS